jgi:hypothetical protein
MTTPLYGDDPATSQNEGFFEGEKLTFEYNGIELNVDINYQSDMEIRRVDISFNSSEIIGVYPNPFTGTTNIEYNLIKDAQVKVIAYDVYGRVVSELANDYQDASVQTITWDASSVKPGIYFINVLVDGELIGNQKVVLTK